jgi:hypothetical protein
MPYSASLDLSPIGPFTNHHERLAKLRPHHITYIMSNDYVDSKVLVIVISRVGEHGTSKLD